MNRSRVKAFFFSLITFWMSFLFSTLNMYVDFYLQAIITFRFRIGYNIYCVRQWVMSRHMDCHGIVSPRAQKTINLHLHYMKLKLPDYQCYKQPIAQSKCTVMQL